jgi:hypothetical protein
MGVRDTPNPGVTPTERTPTTMTTTTRTATFRLRAATVTSALAILVGLSGPAVSAFAAEPATATPVTTSAHAAATWATVAPTAQDLYTQGAPTGQSRIPIGATEMQNARAIVTAGQHLNLPPRAWVIAVATSLQESKLTNLGNLGTTNDHDSLGLFQQRPASGWGSPDQLTNPTYAATAFYNALTNISGWTTMTVTDAAQAVQVSAYPNAYAQWEQQAGDLIDGLYHTGPYAHLTPTN